MGRINIFSEISAQSLSDVYTRFLSKLFSDINECRGVCIDKDSVFRNYPVGQFIAGKPNEVYRPNHGLAHNVRVTSKVRDVIALYADVFCNTSSQSRQWFTRLNTSEEIMKLEIAGSFYVA